MFASLKNKIREEIGNDVSSVVRNAGPVRGMNPRSINQTGSSNSISSSQISLDEPKEPGLRRENSFELKLVDGILTAKDIKKLESREEEWKKRLRKQEQMIQKRLEKKDEEWKVKMQEKDKEWRKLVEKLEKEKVKLEDGRIKTEKAKMLLEVALKDAEEYKKKLYNFQEDAEQLEGFQSQEMAKIKHLLLAKEQEVEEKSHHLKSALSEIDSLKTEVIRLRRYEDELNNIQDLSSKEINRLKYELEETKNRLSSTSAELSQLRMSNEEEKDNNSSLHMQLIRLKENLEIEKSTSATLRLSLEKETDEKDSVLLRNAQISQNYELSQQENRRQKLENTELHGKIDDLEKIVKKMTTEIANSNETVKAVRERLSELENTENERKNAENLEKKLRNNLADLENQLTEKNKTIKILQQRLADMKKTLQRELKIMSSSLESDVEPAILTPSSSKTILTKNNYQEDDVNFKYLKHVLIKFLTSREYEALHLTKAVATLLHFSPEEERLLQETLAWKMSWFGSKPTLGFGQTAKAIPPS